MKVYYFSSGYCGECKELLPCVEAWCESNGAEFVFVDAESPDSAESMRAWGVRSIPCVGIVDGNESFVAIGIGGWNRFIGIKDED